MLNERFTNAMQSRPGRLVLVATLLAILAAVAVRLGLPGGGTGNPALGVIFEIFSVIVGCMIAALVWESRDHRSRGSLLLGCAFLAVAWLSLAHLLSYPGMPPFFTPSSLDKAAGFGLAARLTAALALLLFALRGAQPKPAEPKHGPWLLAASLAYCFGFTWLLLAHPEIAPASPLWNAASSVLMLLAGGGAALLSRRFVSHRHPFDIWLAAAAWIMLLAESFGAIGWADPGPHDLPAHAFKALAYLLIYRAMVVHIVHQPYARLAAESSRNRSILETSLDGIHLIDLEGKVIDSNPAFAEMLGYSPEEIRRLHVADLEAEGGPSEIAAVIERLCQGESNALFETRLRRKDGSLIDAEIAISLARLPDRQFLVVVARNLADRKAKDSLRLAGEVFEHAHVGLLITDADARIVELNPTASEITGYDRAEMLGQRPSVLKSGRHDDNFYQEMWASLLAKGFWSGEICNRRKNGELYYELLSITAIRNRADRHVNYLAVFSDITGRKLAEDRMREIAHFDALTGLPNRLLLADRLNQAIAHSQRSDKLLAICFLDLDGFKQINDSLGHEAGDLLLKEVAIRLQAMLRGSDTVARLGGDEFVMLISGLASEEECCLALDRVLHSIATPYALVGDTLSELSVSIGATLYPADASDPDTLLRHADHAMYAAKQAGKNCYQLFDAHMEQRLQARHDTLRRVARGLAAGQFQLHYQPKVDYRSNTVVGVEALIRWNHPILGKLTPNEFLPLLEDDDLALELGEWVFREAIRQGCQWHGEGIDLCISVNAFPRQLQRPNFPEVVARAVSEVWPTLPAGQLMIEITESAALRELDSVQKAIQECRQLGIAFSLDDFGTGYASLSYLRQLTVDELKIDQSFVRDMLSDAEDLSIINGLIGLGNAFNLKVIAEGVETDAHIQRLLELGCDIMQGYGIARPMPAAQLLAWLQEFSNHSTGR